MTAKQIFKKTGIAPTNPVMDMITELTKPNTPRLRIIVASSAIEILINALVEYHCKNKDKLRDRPQAGKLILLNEMGILSDSRYKLLESFRDLRNVAAHGDKGVKFQINDEIIELFPVTINHKFNNDVKFMHICLNMVTGLWNEHAKVLAAQFPPKLMEIIIPKQ